MHIELNVSFDAQKWRWLKHIVVVELCSPQKWYGEALTPRAPECYLVWK